MPVRNEICENCRRAIGALEPAHLWNDRVVCAECLARLSASQWPTPTARPVVPETPASPRIDAATVQVPEKTLLATRPVMFGRNPIAWVLCVLLSLVVVGLIILIAEYLRCAYTRLTITTRRTTVKTGWLSRSTNEVRHQDVRNIRVTQTFFNRLFGVGKIEISSAAQADIEIAVSGIPNPQEAAALVRQYQT